MEVAKREVLDEFEDRLLEEAPEAKGILQVFRRAELALTRIEPVDVPATKPGIPRTWLLFWAPPNHLRERFELAPEMLMLLVPWREAQVRDIEVAERAIRKYPRLESGVVLLVAKDENAQRRLAQAFQQTGRIYTVASFTQVEAAVDPQRWLLDLLLRAIGTGDLFAAGPPVYGWDFIGRRDELREIRGRLLDGRPVGLYGLRKVGKTSVLLVLRDQLVGDSDISGGRIAAIPIHLDLLRLSFAETNRAGLMRYLLRATHEALGHLDLDPTILDLPASFANRTRLAELDPEDVERLVPVALECLIDWARQQPSHPPVLLFIDEYERLLGSSRFPLTDGIEILDYLRGLVQTYPRRFNFLIAGLDGRLASTSRFGKRQNPLFNFVVDFPLAGLTRVEMGELFRKLGRRLMLQFDPDALDFIWEETGGHPFLARGFGRIVDRSVPPAERKPKKIDLQTVIQQRDEFRRQARATMEEVRDAIANIEPHAPQVLAYALSFPEQADAALEQLASETLEALRGYGVLETKAEPGRIVRMGCFGAWVVANEPLVTPKAAHG